MPCWHVSVENTFLMGTEVILNWHFQSRATMVASCCVTSWPWSCVRVRLPAGVCWTGTSRAWVPTLCSTSSSSTRTTSWSTSAGTSSWCWKRWCWGVFFTFNWCARCLTWYYSSWQSSYKSRLQVFSSTSLAVSTIFFEEASLVLGVHFQQKDLI